MVTEELTVSFHMIEPIEISKITHTNTWQTTSLCNS
jgi:hypothetical protein